MKHEAINSPVELVPFADLYVSPLNPRTVFSPEGIKALAENIRQLGLIQNLAGLRDEAGKVGIVAGGRRLRALDLLQDDPRFAAIPVKLAPDQATAEIWASSENHQREQPVAADEIREYGTMAARGVPVPSIAVAFGVNEKHVYRRLKLASLPAPVLDALKAGFITLSNAAAFTISEDEAHSLAVLEQVKGHGYSDHQIKQLLKPDAVRGTDRRVLFVGQHAYEAEGGRMTGDLFSDQQYFDDVALLEDLFSRKLAASVEAAKAEGWTWAETIGDSYIGYYDLENRKLDRIYRDEGVLTEEQAERYDELAELANGEALDEEGQAELAALQAILDGSYSDEQKAVAGVLLYVNAKGELQKAEGLVRREDRTAAIEAGFLRPSSHAGAGAEDAPKSALSQKLRDDLSRIAQGARQHAILRDPDLLIDLLAYQLSHALRWEKPFGLSTEDVPNWPSTEGSGYQLDERLTDNPARDLGGKDHAKSFRAFRKKGADHVKGELARFLAAHYRGGSKDMAAMLDKETQPNIREVWTPTAANFFSRVSGGTLNDLWCDLLDLAPEHPTATTFAKMKKGEKAERLEALFRGDGDLRSALAVSEKQAAKIAAWLPEGMK